MKTILVTLALGCCVLSTGFAAPRALFKMKLPELFPEPQPRALAEAAARNRTDSIKLLVVEGADVNATGKDGMTPLLWALLQGGKAGFQALLEHGANPNLQTKDGDSVVLMAAIDKDGDYLKLTLAHGGNPNLVDPTTDRTPIYESIRNGNGENVQALIAAGANLNSRDRTGFTPLLEAASLLRYDIAYTMLKAGADPTIRSKGGKTIVDRIKLNNVDPKHELYQWRAKVIELLKTKGIDVE
jgi:uncharacterized protein